MNEAIKTNTKLAEYLEERVKKEVVIIEILGGGYYLDESCLPTKESKQKN